MLKRQEISSCHDEGPIASVKASQFGRHGQIQLSQPEKGRVSGAQTICMRICLSIGKANQIMGEELLVRRARSGLGMEEDSGGLARGVRIRRYLGTGDSGRGCNSPVTIPLY